MISVLEGLMVVWGGAGKGDMHGLFGAVKGRDTTISPIIVSKWHESSSPVGLPRIW